MMNERWCVLVVILMVLVNDCHCDDRSERAAANEKMRARVRVETERGLRRALTNEGVQEYYRLKELGDSHRKHGDFTKAGQAYRKAIHLYAGALAVPYIKYSSFTHLGQNILHKYASDRYSAPADQRVSFLEYEMSKTTTVHDALHRFTHTLNKPHRPR